MERTERTPLKITPAILDFCNSIVPDQQPQYVDVRIAKWSIIQECFSNVDIMIKKFGGRAILGRAIWRWANILIEAEAHAIWESPDGELLDITPNSRNDNKILFLHDPTLIFNGVSIRNIRKPLTDSLLVKELIDICNQFEDVSCRTTERIGVVPEDLYFRRVELQEMMKRPAGRNDPCPCGSNLKYKKCCGY